MFYRINYLCDEWNLYRNMMLCILPQETDPFFCLAAEEFLLKNYEEDIFMIWQSHNAVIVGKHQNTLAEIDYRYVRETGLKVARRISGGGTVFHDLGNINYSCIKNVQGPHEVNFRNFMTPITGALLQLGVKAVISGRNDLVVHERKISGNAEHIYKNRVLHHGTLLFDSNLKLLGQALGIMPGKYRGKAVESTRSAVANISEFMEFPLSRADFIKHLISFHEIIHPDMVHFTIPPKDKEKIVMLSRQKFETPEWQFGYSPPYSFYQTVTLLNKPLSIHLTVDRGIIIAARLSGQYYPGKEALRLEALLIGKYHLFDSVVSAHQALEINFDSDLIYSYF
jgi:lipoate---protein ligase